MPDLEILKYPDDRLGRISTEVSNFSEVLWDQLETMVHLMDQSDGIGLAAPQVNIAKRFFIVKLAPGPNEPEHLYEIVNPRLSNMSGSVTYDEGCLSAPGFTIPIKRYKNITVEYQDRTGETKSLEASGLLAVAIQHEYDHLEGKMFFDRLPFWNRWYHQRKYYKLAKQ